MERPLIVFDVNETLLDLQHVTPILGRIFGDEGVMQLWFANLVLYSCALTLADHYVPFTDIGAAVLEMLAKTRGIEIAPAAKKELTQAFSEMPPYAEVPGALDRLRANGFRLFTLTNNRRLAGRADSSSGERYAGRGTAAAVRGRQPERDRRPALRAVRLVISAKDHPNRILPGYVSKLFASRQTRKFAKFSNSSKTLVMAPKSPRPVSGVQRKRFPQLGRITVLEPTKDIECASQRERRRSFRGHNLWKRAIR
jgi:hypothetical protein